jgi:serine/threonine-protein kinase TNNI3K
VGDLEKEVQKQTELRVMYRKRMERTQDYLRYCLQIAQENGILEHIVQSKGELQHSPLNVSSITNSPQILTPTMHQHHPNLEAIIDQAKINGWYINPTEVSTTHFLKWLMNFTKLWISGESEFDFWMKQFLAQTLITSRSNY